MEAPWALHPKFSHPICNLVNLQIDFWPRANTHHQMSSSQKTEKNYNITISSIIKIYDRAIGVQFCIFCSIFFSRLRRGQFLPVKCACQQMSSFHWTPPPVINCHHLKRKEKNHNITISSIIKIFDRAIGVQLCIFALFFSRLRRAQFLPVKCACQQLSSFHWTPPPVINCHHSIGPPPLT